MNNILLQTFGISQVISMLIVLALYVGIFLLLRPVFMWYWKVDKILENQQKQIEQQQTIIDGLAGLHTSLNRPPNQSTDDNDDVAEL